MTYGTGKQIEITRQVNLGTLIPIMAVLLSMGAGFATWIVQTNTSRDVTEAIMQERLEVIQQQQEQQDEAITRVAENQEIIEIHLREIISILRQIARPGEPPDIPQPPEFRPSFPIAPNSHKIEETSNDEN